MFESINNNENPASRERNARETGRPTSVTSQIIAEEAEEQISRPGPSSGRDENNGNNFPREKQRLQTFFHDFMDGLKDIYASGCKLLDEIIIEHEVYKKYRDKTLALKEEINNLKKEAHKLRHRVEQYAMLEKNLTYKGDANLVQRFFQNAEEESDTDEARRIAEDYNRFEQRIRFIYEAFRARQREIKERKRQIRRLNYDLDSIHRVDIPNVTAFTIMQQMGEDIHKTVNSFEKLSREHEVFQEESQTMRLDIANLREQLRAIRLYMSHNERNDQQLEMLRQAFQERVHPEVVNIRNATGFEIIGFRTAATTLLDMFVVNYD